MSPVRVKICGITRVEDAEAALACGADAIGLVFYDKSPRFVDISTARRIAKAVGPFVSVVGLFVNSKPIEVTTTAEQVGLDILQFHGDEEEAYCQQFNKPYLKAIRMRSGLGAATMAASYKGARGLLFDAWNKEKYGGTGETFDWSRVPKKLSKPIILAGGLTSTNVAEAVAATNPYAVDVSGGVEIAPGLKSEQLIKQFILNAKSAQNK